MDYNPLDMPLTGPGRVAFSLILIIGAVTGVLAYVLFSQATPGHSIFTSSRFFEPLPPPLIPSQSLPSGEDTGETTTSGAGSNENSANNASEIPANAVTIDILEGAAVQGNPNYQPDKTEAKIDSTIVWTNGDSLPHTATSGTEPDDANAGKLFDSGLLDSGQNYSIAADKIGTGEHPYFCQVHPYMKGMLTVVAS
jgi:plastocyanin